MPLNSPAMAQNDAELGGNESDPKPQLTKIANLSEDFEKKARFSYLLNLWPALLCIFPFSFLCGLSYVSYSYFCTNVGSIMPRVRLLSLALLQMTVSYYSFYFLSANENWGL